MGRISYCRLFLPSSHNWSGNHRTERQSPNRCHKRLYPSHPKHPRSASQNLPRSGQGRSYHGNNPQPPIQIEQLLDPGDQLELVWQVENYRSIKITSCPSQESHHVEFEEPTRADLEQANSKADFQEMPSFQIEGWDELNLFLEAVTKGASNYLEIKILVVKARL